MQGCPKNSMRGELELLTNPSTSAEQYKLSQAVVAERIDTLTDTSASETLTLPELLSRFSKQLFFKMKKARESILAPSEACCPNITFLLVHASSSSKLQYRFFSARTPALALDFYKMWVATQRSEIPRRHTTLMECGPGNAACLRKWAIDLDGDMQSLRAYGFLRDGQTCTPDDKSEIEAMVKQYAVEMCVSLRDIGFTEETCHFCIKTRHQENKLSFHITLMIMAAYDAFRAAILQVSSSLLIK